MHNLKADYDNDAAPVVATELVGTSISSNGDGLVYGPMVPFNENIEFFDGDRRGYVLCKLDHEVWRTEPALSRACPTRTPPSTGSRRSSSRTG